MKQYVSLMNRFVANQMVFYMKLHNLHWYIKGSSFFTLHAEYEKLYDNTTAVLDEVAERMLMLGYSPLATLKDALELSTIEERKALDVGGSESVEIALKDLEQLESESREILRLAAEDGDEGTADQFTGYVRAYQKLIWMLRAYLKN